MRRFMDLKVWQKSHALTLAIYRMSNEFPGPECYGLSSQIRRAAASVATNIAEGSKRTGRQEYSRFLNIAEGLLPKRSTCLYSVGTSATYRRAPPNLHSLKWVVWPGSFTRLASKWKLVMTYDLSTLNS